MTTGLLLESKLKSLSDKDAKGGVYWASYVAMKDYLENNYFKWVQAECPYFTDHGRGHVESVIHAAGLLLEKRLNSSKSASGITTLDLFVLLSGIIWHDVGNVLGRSGHEKRIIELSQKISELGFPSPDIRRIVDEISRAHAGPDGLKIPQNEFDFQNAGNTYTIYPKSLAAVLRFSDELSENRNRISQELLPRLPPENRIYWEYANCISASKPEPARERVVITFTLDAEKVTKEYVCPNEYLSRGRKGKISLINYVICRLEKINRERAYCAQHLAKYVMMNQVEARFVLVNKDRRIPGFDDDLILGDGGINAHNYPDIDIYEAFFALHKKWKPAELKKLKL